jgi:hypothetical protein
VCKDSKIVRNGEKSFDFLEHFLKVFGM